MSPYHMKSQYNSNWSILPPSRTTLSQHVPTITTTTSRGLVLFFQGFCNTKLHGRDILLSWVEEQCPRCRFGGKVGGKVPSIFFFLKVMEGPGCVKVKTKETSICIAICVYINIDTHTINKWINQINRPRNISGSLKQNNETVKPYPQVDL